jgi:hypothetical protein
MNNKPVAFVTGVRQFDPVMADTVLKVGTPLYTHPAKTLTDEEIIDIAKEHIHQRLEGERFGYVDFARAILRKAQDGH